MNITIDSSIKQITPEFHIAAMTADVVVKKDQQIDLIIREMEYTFHHQYSINDVVEMDIIKQGRDAYKAYGKDPSRYRLATESLVRRIVKGNPLYRINNVVDLGNIISLKTLQSVAVLDQDKIHGDILVRLGTDSDDYEGIGRGKLNISNIPLYEDELGPFGSTTSDTLRTSIQNDTTRILLFIISFTGSGHLNEQIEDAAKLFTQYASAKNIKTWLI